MAFDDDDDIFATMGGSLLNDLLSDLDNNRNDDLFTSLEQELATSYFGSSNNKFPPGLASAAAFVVKNQQSQQVQSSTAIHQTTITNPEDAWSAALAQFGGMSLAADFLAADTAKKHQQTTGGSSGHPDLVQTESGMLGEAISSNVVDALFDDEEGENEEYKVEEDVQLDGDGVDETGGLMALLGAASSRPLEKNETDASPASAPEMKGGNKVVVTKSSDKSTQVGITPRPPPITPDESGTMAPIPSPNFPPPFPPGVMMPPMMHPPPPHPGMMMMMMPPSHPHHGMGMMTPPPMQGMPPPHLGMIMGRPPVVPPPSAKYVDRKFNRDFPALGAEPEEKSQDEDYEESNVSDAILSPPPMHNHILSKIRIIFNNADPSAPSIPAKSVATSLMPQRDLCYIIHSMLRPLQSLDTYNDDYYHWSFVDRKSRNLLLLGGADRPAMSSLAQPNPVWKEVKVMALERETKFRSAVESRAKEFAEEKQSLGRMVKTNVKRPKALLNVPVMTTVDDESGDGGNDINNEAAVDDKDYVLEQRRNRVQLWKARVSIDKGYSAFLSLTELRRLIQANASQPQLVNELMGDVKSNVDMMHASLGVNVRVNSDGTRTIIIDQARLSNTLSLPKGRVLCARVIEGGILPHQSACEILPVAWHVIATKPSTSVLDDGEDRLLRALTGLVLTVQPSVDQSILCRCLDATITIGDDMSNITKSRVRMELLHSILSRGKTVCADDSGLNGVWKVKEKAFMQILSSQQK